MSTTPATLPKLRSWLPPGCSAYPKPEDPTLYVMWLVSAMKNAGFSYETIIDAFLWDIGSGVKGIARQGSASAKKRVMHSVSEFSENCEGLIGPDRPFHPGHH